MYIFDYHYNIKVSLLDRRRIQRGRGQGEAADVPDHKEGEGGRKCWHSGINNRDTGVQTGSQERATQRAAPSQSSRLGDGQRSQGSAQVSLV